MVPKRDPDQPARFVMLGTIEPRKNHDLMLNVWEGFVATPPAVGIPRLTIVGSRGWAGAQVFERLDALKATGHVEEIADASDEEAADILAGASGLLFPSAAEGFGLPALEATLQGIPCLCTPLDVFEEVLGEIPVYLAAGEDHRWRDNIIRLMLASEQKNEQARIDTQVSKQGLPNWENHFKNVLRMIG